METKTVGAIYADVKALDTKDPSGAFEAVLSTQIVDRDGEVVAKGAFLPLPKSIPIHVNHEFMDVAKVVGRGEPYYDGDVLKVKGIFASTPDAQTVRTLVAEGMVQTMSVGFFQPTREEKDGVPHVTKATLIEASFVSIPANTDALVTMAKRLDVDLVMPTLKAISDQINALTRLVTAQKALDDATNPPPPAADPEGKAAAPASAGTAAPPPADVNVGMALAAIARLEADLLTT